MSDGDCFDFAADEADNDVDVIFIDFEVARERPTCKSAVCGLCFPFEWFMFGIFCCDEGWLSVVPFSFPPPLGILLELFDRLLICLESVPNKYTKLLIEHCNILGNHYIEYKIYIWKYPR